MGYNWGKYIPFTNPVLTSLGHPREVFGGGLLRVGNFGGRHNSTFLRCEISPGKPIYTTSYRGPITPFIPGRGLPCSESIAWYSGTDHSPPIGQLKMVMQAGFCFL